ncbi:tryptophan synthase beta subunit-like PLP-dependent enzyme [Obelidium mucronatum]|nr:tryptophan synthase beta subunit-like PLP-dependent enzyme [Obelidium mucronatum]
MDTASKAALLVATVAVTVAAAAALVRSWPSQETSRHSKKRKELQTVSTLSSTPLILVPSLSNATGCKILGKMELLSAGGSSKDRLARAVITDAEEKGLIEPYQEHVIVEGTVGSTGISLATISNAKGYKCLIIMPDDQAKEKYDLLTQLGATIEKVRPCSIADSNHFVRIAERRAAEINQASKLNANGKPIKAFFVNQFETPVNFETHFTQTGPEIKQQLIDHGIEKLDSFVMGAGTGGTLSGVSLSLKSEFPDLRVILADPEGSGLFFKVKSNIMYSPTEAEGTRKRHQVDTIVEGIGINRLTKNFQIALNVPSLITDASKVTDQEAVEMSRFLLRNDGLFCGSSTAVHLVAAYREALRLGPGHTIVTFLCDSGTRHLTKFWNEDYIAKAGLVPKSRSATVDFL